MWWEGVGGDLKGFKINRGMERSERKYNWQRVHSWGGGVCAWKGLKNTTSLGRTLSMVQSRQRHLNQSHSLWLRVPEPCSSLVRDELQGIGWFVVYELFHLFLQTSQVYLSAVWLGWSLGHSVWHAGFVLTMRRTILKSAKGGMKPVLVCVSIHHCVAVSHREGAQNVICLSVVWWGLIALCKLDIVIKGIFFQYKNTWNLRDPNYLKQSELLTSLIPG